jgi:hypothetical protein
VRTALKFADPLPILKVPAPPADSQVMPTSIMPSNLRIEPAGNVPHGELTAPRLLEVLRRLEQGFYDSLEVRQTTARAVRKDLLPR